MNILLVEDEPLLRHALERWLVAEGHTMCWAATAPGATELLRTETVDVILLDIMLAEGTDGYAVLRARHANPRWRQIPVIIMSALSPGAIHEGARILEGTLIVLGKPPDLDHLRSSLSIIEGTKGA